MTATAPRPRGRPRLISPDMMRASRKHAPHIHTDRQHQAHHYGIYALSVLDLLPGSEAWAPWLVDHDHEKQGKQGAIKWSVLEQLGRMAVAGVPVAALRDLVAAIETNPPTAKEATRWLRELRRSRRVAADD